MEIPEFLPFGAAIASFLVAGGLVAWVSKQPAGTKEMMDISNAVKEGAAAFLKREMKIIITKIPKSFFVSQSQNNPDSRRTRFAEVSDLSVR